MLAHIYRGILDILHAHHAQLRKNVTEHIRKFDEKNLEDKLSDVSVYGFWRMLLELIFNTYIHICLGVGILLAFTLVLVSWPIRAIFGLYFQTVSIKNQMMYDMTEPVDQNIQQVNLPKYNVNEGKKLNASTTKRSK
jgi:hypothetical protein